MQKNRRAFTLSELLVTVVILGILAAVAVPKFTRVLETRRTSEAEDLLGALRTEQEKRCALGKPYQVRLQSVDTLAGAGQSKNYFYSLQSQGAEAKSRNRPYSVKMLSYKDGVLCCDGDYCLSLNKDYPLCSSLTVQPDECAGEMVLPDPQPRPDPKPLNCPADGEGEYRSCGCNQTGTQTRSCDTGTGQWSVWTPCSVPLECDCEAVSGPHPALIQACKACGTQTRNVSCDSSTGQWLPGAWGECQEDDSCRCEDAYGKPERYYGYGKGADTCPGSDSYSWYTCSDGFKGTCLDIKSSDEKAYQDVTARKNKTFLELSGWLASTDTCPGGSTKQKYTCTAQDYDNQISCRDVYWEPSSTIWYAASYTNGRPDCKKRGCDCPVKIKDIAYIVEHRQDYCDELIGDDIIACTCDLNTLTGSSSYPTYQTLQIFDKTIDKAWCSLQCKHKYTQQDVTCRSVRKRTVTCCGKK